MCIFNNNMVKVEGNYEYTGVCVRFMDESKGAISIPFVQSFWVDTDTKKVSVSQISETKNIQKEITLDDVRYVTILDE